MHEMIDHKKIHMMGICGTGMSALAGLLKEKGALVSGSDTQFYPPIGPMLKAMNIEVFTGFDPKNIPQDTELFIIGNVIGRGNPEAEWVLNGGRAYESMAEALYRFVMADRSPVVIAGTHGKTTTTAFLAHLFSQAGGDPGYFIAGNPLDLPRHYGLGSGKWFFVEGDEYETSFFDRASKFLHYRPHDLILTALEHDHVDFFPEPASYQKSFANLINTVPGEGLIIYNHDYAMAREVIKASFSQTIAFGFSAGLAGSVQIEVQRVHAGGIDFVIPWRTERYRFSTPLMGQYNLINLCAGILYGINQGLDIEQIGEAVKTFHGVERRMSRLGEQANTLFFEDFAHHPTAIAAAIKAVKDAYPDRPLLTLFEPRSWSLRRNRFADALAHSLQDSDETWICDIFQKEKIAATERLDVHMLVSYLQGLDRLARVASDAPQIWNWLEALDLSQPRVVLLLSNGAFGGLPQKVRDLCVGQSPG